MTKLFFEMNAYDIKTRIADESRIPLVPLVHAHELTRGGPVMHDDNVKVTAALVRHPPVVPAFGYRFDAPDRSIVISGDTAPSDNLIAFARGPTSSSTKPCMGQGLIAWLLAFLTLQRSGKASCLTTPQPRMPAARRRGPVSKRWSFPISYRPTIRP
jgi:hypothetical protein